MLPPMVASVIAKAWTPMVASADVTCWLMPMRRPMRNTRIYTAAIMLLSRKPKRLAMLRNLDAIK